MEPQGVIPLVKEASKWTWEGWFAAALFCLGVVIVFSARFILSKLDGTLKELQQQRDEKEKLLREIINAHEKSFKESAEQNKAWLIAMERNTRAIETNTELLRKHGIPGHI